MITFIKPLVNTKPKHGTDVFYYKNSCCPMSRHLLQFQDHVHPLDLLISLVVGGMHDNCVV